MDRRSLIGLTALAAASWSLKARAEVAMAVGGETIALWPSAPPGGEPPDMTLQVAERSNSPALHDRVVWNIARPTLTVFRPARPDGSALLIMPGGGYSNEAFEMEGSAPALRFGQSGITAFVLTYRLPGEGWKDGPDVPLQDAQRAMRIIRARGPKDYGIDPARIGALGFSAGGHLAGSLATHYARRTYAAVDDIDTVDARPSFAALLYPVVTMLAPFAHEASREKLLGAVASVALRQAYSVERAVAADTPTCFLCAADDDPDVPTENSLMMFASLRAAKVLSEMHIFENGGHGFGLGPPGTPEAAWPDLMLRWGAAHGFFRGVATGV